MSERRTSVGVAAGFLGTPWDGHEPGRPAEAMESADAGALLAGGGESQSLSLLAAAKMAAWKQLVGCAPRRRSSRVPKVLPLMAWRLCMQGRGCGGKRGGGRDRAPRTWPHERPRGTCLCGQSRRTAVQDVSTHEAAAAGEGRVGCGGALAPLDARPHDSCRTGHCPPREQAARTVADKAREPL